VGNQNDKHRMPIDLRIEFKKDDNYSSFFAEGAFGGITPSGLIHFDLYCDQGAVPSAVHHQIDQAGAVGPEIESKREMHPGLVRLLKAGITMPPPAAEALARWLQDKVDLLKKQQAEESGDESSIS